MTTNLDEMKLEATRKQSEASSAIRDTKTVYDAKASEIRENRHLTGEGRGAALSDLRTELLTELTEDLNSKREAYEQANEKALSKARDIITQSKHDVPGDSEIALFTKDLTELKTSLMLESRYNTALQRVSDFEAKYQDGYYAEATLAEFPALISTVMELADNKDEARSTLRRLHNTLSDRAKTDAQKQAEHFIEYNSRTFIGRSSMDHNIILDLFGASTAYKLADK